MTPPNDADRAQVLADLRAMYEANEVAIAMYREMLRVALDYGHEYEIDRITEDLRECEANRDAHVQQASELGVARDDLEP